MDNFVSHCSIEFLKNLDESHENFDIKYFLKFLKHQKYKRRKRRILENNIIIIQNNDEEKFYYNMKYYYHENIVIELENLFRKNKKEYEYEYLNKKENVKKKKREIHKEKFKMCIHKFKILLPDHLIYKIGNFFKFFFINYITCHSSILTLKTGLDSITLFS